MCVCTLCAVTRYNSGQVFSLLGQPITAFAIGDDLKQTYAVLLCDTVIMVTDAILSAFAGPYFKTEQAEGTPFTVNGAKLIRKLAYTAFGCPSRQW